MCVVCSQHTHASAPASLSFLLPLLPFACAVCRGTHSQKRTERIWPRRGHSRRTEGREEEEDRRTGEARRALQGSAPCAYCSRRLRAFRPSSVQSTQGSKQPAETGSLRHSRCAAGHQGEPPTQEGGGSGGGRGRILSTGNRGPGSDAQSDVPIVQRLAGSELAERRTAERHLYSSGTPQPSAHPLPLCGACWHCPRFLHWTFRSIRAWAEAVAQLSSQSLELIHSF
jgi:hypothetical protein